MIIDTEKLKSLHDIKSNKNSNWDESVSMTLIHG